MKQGVNVRIEVIVMFIRDCLNPKFTANKITATMYLYMRELMKEGYNYVLSNIAIYK
jgi:hypothetical protein